MKNMTLYISTVNSHPLIRFICFIAEPTKRIQLTAVPISRNWHFGKEDIDELLFMLQVITRPKSSYPHCDLDVLGIRNFIQLSTYISTTSISNFVFLACIKLVVESVNDNNILDKIECQAVIRFLHL